MSATCRRRKRRKVIPEAQPCVGLRHISGSPLVVLRETSRGDWKYATRDEPRATFLLLSAPAHAVQSWHCLLPAPATQVRSSAAPVLPPLPTATLRRSDPQRNVRARLQFAYRTYKDRVGLGASREQCTQSLLQNHWCRP